MPPTGDSLPWHDVNRHFRDRFGRKVTKILLNSGLPCPHAAGGKGCVFCQEEAVLPGEILDAPPVDRQLEAGAAALTKKYGPTAHLAYFQRGTSAAVPVSRLRPMLETALARETVVALSVGARPDCLDDATLDLLAWAARHRPVLVDLGLQSAQDATLRRIRRGHDSACFEASTRRLAAIPGVEVVAHLILGLPGEGVEEARDSARFLAALPVAGVKLHHLQVVAGTELERQWLRGEIPTLKPSAYVPMLADVLELLPWKVVIHRLMGDLPLAHLVAPCWRWRKHDLVKALVAEFEGRGSRQGSRAES